MSDWNAGVDQSLEPQDDERQILIEKVEELQNAFDATASVANTLHFALNGLYKDQVDYLTLNHLGGMDNHWMRASRIALADYSKFLKSGTASSAEIAAGPAEAGQPWRCQNMGHKRYLMFQCTECSTSTSASEPK